MNEHGGIWLDTDVIFCKKISDELWDIALSDGFIISYENTITTGFLGFPKTSYVTKLALQMADQKMINSQFEKKYEAVGPNLWKKLFLEYPHAVAKVQFLSEKLVYPITCRKLDQFFFSENESINYEETIGVHWYGGSTYARSFTNNNLMFSIAQKIPLTNFQKVIFRLNNEIDLLGQLPSPIDR